MRAKAKYSAVPTVVDGIRFASKKEARRYGELKLLLKAGQIRGLLLQPVYGLFAYPVGRDPVRVGKYIGDFQYEEPVDWAKSISGWRKVVEDVKGVKTPIYRLKKRLVEAQYGIQIRET